MSTPISFFQQTYDELKKVTCPSRNDVVRLTLIVIFISVAVGAYIGGIDYILTKITEILIK